MAEQSYASHLLEVLAQNVGEMKKQSAEWAGEYDSDTDSREYNHYLGKSAACDEFLRLLTTLKGVVQ